MLLDLTATAEVCLSASIVCSCILFTRVLLLLLLLLLLSSLRQVYLGLSIEQRDRELGVGHRDAICSSSGRV